MVSGKYRLDNGYLFKPESVHVTGLFTAVATCGCGQIYSTSVPQPTDSRARDVVILQCKNCPRCREIAAEHSEATPTP